MFMGQYSHKLDAKGRIILPSKFRDDLGTEFIIARGLDGCLSVYPMGKWQEIADKLSSLPSTKKMARDYSRLVLSSAANVEFDKTGRVNIPSHLLKIANIDKECMVIGVGDSLEIWDVERWSQYNSAIDSSFEDIAEELVDFEL
jgi:MraZ protein